MIAAGMLGDESVVEQVRGIVESEPDVSMRALALRAYAWTAKQKAIPFLRQFANDQTTGGTDCHGRLFPLQIVARDELAELEPKTPRP